MKINQVFVRSQCGRIAEHLALGGCGKSTTLLRSSDPDWIAELSSISQLTKMRGVRSYRPLASDRKTKIGADIFYRTATGSIVYRTYGDAVGTIERQW